MELQGKKVVVTRAKEQASALSHLIRQNGGIPIEIPLLSFEAIEDRTEINEAIDSLHTYDWLVFTSKNGIEFFLDAVKARSGSVALLDNNKKAVVGKKTLAILERHHLQADLMPDKFVAESLVERLLEVVNKGEKVLIPKGNLARDVIATKLRENAIIVRELDVYKTVLDRSSTDFLKKVLCNGEVDIVTFTSSSTVENFVQLLKEDHLEGYLNRMLFASIGPITSGTMRKYGIPVDIEASEYTIDGLMKSVIEKLKGDHDHVRI